MLAEIFRRMDLGDDHLGGTSTDESLTYKARARVVWHRPGLAHEGPLCWRRERWDMVTPVLVLPWLYMPLAGPALRSWLCCCQEWIGTMRWYMKHEMDGLVPRHVTPPAKCPMARPAPPVPAPPCAPRCVCVPCTMP